MIYLLVTKKKKKTLNCLKKILFKLVNTFEGQRWLKKDNLIKKNFFSRYSVQSKIEYRFCSLFFFLSCSSFSIFLDPLSCGPTPPFILTPFLLSNCAFLDLKSINACSIIHLSYHSLIMKKDFLSVSAV